jgi:hypothetical protein
MAIPYGRFRAWVKGQLVGFAEMLDLQQATRGLVGGVAYAVAGVQNFLPNANALNLVPGGGMNVTLGGANQYCFLQPEDGSAGSKLAYALGANTITIGANSSGSQRNDLICVQFTNTSSQSYSSKVRADSGAVNPTVVYIQDETFSFQTVVGTPGAGDPAVPPGYVAFARVRVINGASSIDAGHIDILLPTLSKLIAFTAGTGITIAGGSISNTGVLSVNSETGAILLESSDSSVTITPGSGTIDFKVAGSTASGMLMLGETAGAASVAVTTPAASGGPTGKFRVRALLVAQVGDPSGYPEAGISASNAGTAGWGSTPYGGIGIGGAVASGKANMSSGQHKTITVSYSATYAPGTPITFGILADNASYGQSTLEVVAWAI